MMKRRTVRRSEHTIIKTFPEKEKHKHLKEFCIQKYINQKDPSIAPKIVDCKGSSRYKIESDAKTTNLQILLDKNCLSEKRITEIMYQVGYLIKRLHKIGIRHNDIYPCNITVDTNDYHCYLIDFEKAEFILLNGEKSFERDIIMYNNMARKYCTESVDTNIKKLEPDFERYNYMRNEEINIDKKMFENLLDHNIKINNLTREDINDVNVIRVMLLIIILPSKEVYEVASNLTDIDNISEFIKTYDHISKHIKIEMYY